MARYRSPEGAAAYREKHRRSLIRRVADRRERKLLCRMLRRLARVDSILDCPCGTGRFLPSVARYASSVWAIDQSEPMVRLASHASGFAVGDAGALPLASRSVDVVVCCRLLHHFPAPEARVRILAEAARVARRAVIVSFADADTWKGRRTKSRRRPISRAQLRHEAASAGLELEPPILAVCGFFSCFAFAFLRVA